jgi:hypothetical protein
MPLQTTTPILAYLNKEETIHFYTTKLRFKFISEWEDYLIFTKDNVELHFWKTDNPVIPQNTGCYIRVTEVDKLYSEYNKFDIMHPHGGLQNKPWEMRQFSILDNSGNILHFGEDISGEL